MIVTYLDIRVPLLGVPDLSVLPMVRPVRQRLDDASLAQLLFDDVDVLVLSRFGKDISEQGADPDVMGRSFRSVSVGGPSIDKIVALDLTEASLGDAFGFGVMDIITERFLRKVDLKITYGNCAMTTYFDAAALPMVARSFADAIALAVTNVPERRPEELRVIYARDTQHLSTIYVSEGLYDAVERSSRLQFLGPPRRLYGTDDELSLWFEDGHADNEASERRADRDTEPPSTAVMDVPSSVVEPHSNLSETFFAQGSASEILAVVGRDSTALPAVTAPRSKRETEPHSNLSEAFFAQGSASALLPALAEDEVEPSQLDDDEEAEPLSTKRASVMEVPEPDLDSDK